MTFRQRAPKNFSRLPTQIDADILLRGSTVYEVCDRDQDDLFICMHVIAGGRTLVYKTARDLNNDIDEALYHARLDRQMAA